LEISVCTVEVCVLINKLKIANVAIKSFLTLTHFFYFTYGLGDGPKGLGISDLVGHASSVVRVTSAPYDVLT